ncbi:unnamed protein product [Victoria cruziana]
MAHFLFLLLVPLSLFLLLYVLVRPRPTRVPIRGRDVVISGGSSGIGLAIAQQAASEGARVTILARDAKKLEEASRSIQKATGNAYVTTLSVDVRDFAAVQRAMESCPSIDVLICNHGVFVPQELEEQTVDAVKYMLDINLLGTFNLIKAALPIMKKRKDNLPASIALMSSQAGQVGIYGYAAYSASKFGLRGLGEALQQEVIADNIHITLIFPPDTETPGLLEERKTRPSITNILAESSSAMQAKDVARKALDGIKSATFVASCNFDGFMLSLATSGMSPQRSVLIAFIEVVAAGLLRLVALFYQWKWYRTIEQCHAKEKKRPLNKACLCV